METKTTERSAPTKAVTRRTSGRLTTPEKTLKQPKPSCFAGPKPWEMLTGEKSSYRGDRHDTRNSFQRRRRRETH